MVTVSLWVRHDSNEASMSFLKNGLQFLYLFLLNDSWWQGQDLLSPRSSIWQLQSASGTLCDKPPDKTQLSCCSSLGRVKECRKNIKIALKEIVTCFLCNTEISPHFFVFDLWLLTWRYDSRTTTRHSQLLWSAMFVLNSQITKLRLSWMLAIIKGLTGTTLWAGSCAL